MLRRERPLGSGDEVLVRFARDLRRPLQAGNRLRRVGRLEVSSEKASAGLRAPQGDAGWNTAADHINNAKPRINKESREME
jgi:hypothetical protein